MSDNWFRVSRRRFSALSMSTLGSWLLPRTSLAQSVGAATSLERTSAAGTRSAIGMPQNPQVQGDSQSVFEWAASAAYDIRVFPDGEKEPLAGPGILYGTVGTVDLKLDVFTPGSETVVRPTVVYYHGGGWVHLRKEERALYLLSYLARGMNVVNVEYRLANVAPAPAAVEDVRRALHWTYAHAQQYGFDVNKLVVMGESAGGHLALMAGMLNEGDGFDDSFAWSLRNTPVKAAAIVNYFGPTDLVAMLDEDPTPPFMFEWLGSRPDRREFAKKLSPLTYVRKDNPPIITIHGDNDHGVPYKTQALPLRDALAKAGVPNEVITIPHGQHGQRSWPRDENIRAQKAIFKFLEAHGILPTQA